MNDVSWETTTNLTAAIDESLITGLPPPLNPPWPMLLPPNIEVDGDEETEMPPSKELFFFGLFRN